MNFVDLHIHGAFGVDLVAADSAALDRLALGLAGRGYDAFLPTLVPLRPDALDRVADHLGAWMRERRAGDGRGALPLGVHFEGPFVSDARSGALHSDCFLDGRDARASSRFFAAFERFPGTAMVTLAPEIPGGLELVAEFRRRKTLVSIGHTDATYAELEAAFAAGARHMTHFCNAMRPMHHREPGPIAYGLLQREISVDVIADGHHLHPRMLELIAREGR
ncbi:MAG: amidohydrolase family protein [Planctomycetes bacterium]|nr:amidohydrolase family protein [Planctomycetota bacterium]